MSPVDDAIFMIDLFQAGDNVNARRILLDEVYRSTSRLRHVAMAFFHFGDCCLGSFVVRERRGPHEH